MPSTSQTERKTGYVIQIQKRRAEMLGRPLTKLSAKRGFEQTVCFRRTGIKSSYKAEKLYALEMAAGQRTFRQAKLDRKSYSEQEKTHLRR